MSLAEQQSASRAPLSATLEANRHFLFFVLAHALAATGVAHALGLDYNLDMLRRLGFLFFTLVPAFILVILFLHFGRLAVVVRPENPIRQMREDVLSVLLDRERMISGLLCMALIVLFFGGFSFFKDAVPVIRPFSWDVAFAAADRALHFGHDPWRLTWAVFGAPLATTALNAAYHFWFFLIYFMVFFACFSAPRSRDRNVFLLAFVLTWAIGGNAMAIWLSSAGPVYYERLGFGETFEPLMTLLRASHETSPVWALGIQEMLWDGYAHGGPMTGISAMPSMHVASSVIVALYCWSLSRFAGILAWIFVGVIQIGSVHLAWHYAIDGYLGGAVAVALWLLAKRAIPASNA